MLQKITHNAFIKVDRNGTKAVAVSCGAGMAGCVPDFDNLPKVVNSNRPFIYAIIHKKTGLPGPILSMTKELSVLPLFKNMKIEDNTLSVFLSKLFNGTLFARRDESGKIIKDSVQKLDLRGEMGIAKELGCY